jgi:hypothetical protein
VGRGDAGVPGWGRYAEYGPGVARTFPVRVARQVCNSKQVRSADVCSASVSVAKLSCDSARFLSVRLDQVVMLWSSANGSGQVRAEPTTRDVGSHRAVRSKARWPAGSGNLLIDFALDCIAEIAHPSTAAWAAVFNAVREQVFPELLGP